MYKIGEFSKITGLTVKALRYYHEEGIIIPDSVDNMTGYRLYDKQQIDIAGAVRLLRDCTFSVKEIKEIISTIDDLNDLPYFMNEKIETIENEMASLKKIKKKLINETNKQKDVKNMNDYEVNEKTLDSQLVLSVRYKGAYDECGKYMGELYKQAKGQNKDGPFNRYYDEGYEEVADVEVCLPIKKEVKTTGDIEVKTLPSEEGIAVIHIGPYDQIGGAYQALADYASEKGLDLDVPCREYYLKGPGMLFRGNPNKYVTEVFMPIKNQ